MRDIPKKIYVDLRLGRFGARPTVASIRRDATLQGVASLITVAQNDAARRVSREHRIDLCKRFGSAKGE
jgi:hypothetical protein